MRRITARGRRGERGARRRTGAGALIAAGLLVAAALSLPSCSGSGLPAPAARVDEQAPLGRKSGEYRVFLPPGYPDDGPYPVLYFLHDGLGNSRRLWWSGVSAEIEARMSAGEIVPFLIVSPEGDHGYWSDWAGGRRRYEEWVTSSLREEIETAYPVRAGRSFRALSGISMGGHGAIKIVLKHPDLYAAASSLSGALEPLTRERVAESNFFYRLLMRRVFGPPPDPGESDAMAPNDPHRLLEGAAAAAAAPRLYLRCGTEDRYGLDEGAALLADRARAAGLEVELVLEPGEHEWPYWRRTLPETVAWHGERFSEAGAGAGD